MIRRRWMSFNFIVPALVALLLAVAISCGGDATTAPAETTAPPATDAPEAPDAPEATPAPDAPEATPAPDAPEATPAPDEPEDTATPAPEPEVTAAPTEAPVTDAPYGELRVAFGDIGSYQAHPCTTGSPAVQFITMTAFEGLVSNDVNGNYIPQITESWSIAPDNTTWTFNLKQGVQFHGGLGELTVDDVMYSVEQMCEGSATGIDLYTRRNFLDPGIMTAPDDYTLVTDTVEPRFDMLIWLSSPGVNGLWIVNKDQTEELVAAEGVESASPQLVGTGPWEYVDSQTGEFWRFKAVEDHYRKTPYFAELTILEIPLQASRVANFQVGRLDTFGATPDQVPLLAATPGTKFMSQAAASQSGLRLYGQYYNQIAAGEDPLPAYKPDELPWVSRDADVTSAEWERARKVREALSISIDREKIIETLLHGEGAPLTMWGWMEPDARRAAGVPGSPVDWVWEYDVERAKQLLAEAGYPDGFDILLNPVDRGAPGATEACEAIADMWADIGLAVRIENQPYSVLRGQFGAYTWGGATCHDSGPYREPAGFYSFLWWPWIGWSGGLEHPYLHRGNWDTGFEGKVEELNVIFDAQKRFDASVDIGQWVWDNVLDIGLYYQNNVYPLGPAVDSWGDKLSRSDTRNVHAFEWAPHRQ